LLKKTITYTDFNGDLVTEDHYFHLSKADLVEMELSVEGGMHDYLKAIVESENGKAILSTFKDLILSAYGERSEDGKRFIKSPVLREEFQSTEAYSALFMELCTDPKAAADFVNGIVPAGIDEDIAKLTNPEKEGIAKLTDPNREGGLNVSVFQEHKPVTITVAELQEMDVEEVEEVQKGLLDGTYKLAP